MTKKRTRLELFIDILSEMSSGTCKPTNIMYRCNLSWKPLQEILDSMVQQDLIRVVQKRKRKTYEITEKGMDTLKYIEKARALVAFREVRNA